MKKSAAFLKAIAVASLLCGPCAAVGVAAERPNILVILADDIGFSDLGCYGGEIRTPNLDALAADGLRFTQFYNGARCCPSRASLLTGLYAQQTGVGLMTADRGAKFPGAGDQGDQFPGYRGSLNESCVTIAQVLKPAGYSTFAAGKWHVGDAESPIARGFDDFYGFTRGYAVDSYDEHMMTRLPADKPARSYDAGKFFATDAITDHALDFLAAARTKSRPWLGYVAFQAAHFPVQSRADDMAGYPEIFAQGWDAIRAQRLERMKKLGLISADTALSPRSRYPKPEIAQHHGSVTADGNNPAWDSLDADRRADLAQRMAIYAGMITGMDRNIGRLVADLKAHGDYERTLILFLSDNGACAEWDPFGFDYETLPRAVEPGTGIDAGTQALPNVLHRGEALANMHRDALLSAGSAWANACNTPFRLYKHYDHEGGISTPLIAHWPAGIAAKGELRTQPAHIIDVMATCVGLSGATYPQKENEHEILPMEGRSLLPAFENHELTRKAPLFWEHEGNAAVRDGDMKIARVGWAGAWELYNISRDRVELHDLAAAQPEKVRALAAQWEAWAWRTHVLPAPGAPQK